MLAIVIDTLIMLAGRLITPWTRATGGGRKRGQADGGEAAA